MPTGCNENENTSQQHGIDFENLIKASHNFAGACNAARSGIAVHDIEARFDRKFGIATSVKVTGSNNIGLADAARFYDINIHRRFIIGEWIQQNSKCKLFVGIHEFILPVSLLTRIRGNIEADEVLSYHRSISAFSKGPDGARQAREEAEKIKNMVAGRTGKIKFEFKIDDRNERRLQAAIKLTDLIAATEKEPLYEANGHSQPLYQYHDTSFCQYMLPIAILSPARQIVETTTQELLSAGSLFDCLEHPQQQALMDEDLQRQLLA